MPASDAVWACVSDDDRAGDIDQVRAIAWALDPAFRKVELTQAFERLREARVDSRGTDAALPPKAIVGIGRKRIEMATTIREWSGGATRLIHIGRNRGHLDQLDCLVTTAAFPTAHSPKILKLDLVPSDRIRRWLAERNGPKAQEMECVFRLLLDDNRIGPSWMSVFIGDSLEDDPQARHERVAVLASRLDRLAQKTGLDLVISGSPRTGPDIYQALGATLKCRHYLYRWATGDSFNPFEPMLGGTRCSVVTGDSVTMISQIIGAGHRTLVFPWNEAGDRRTKRIFASRRKRPAKDLDAFCGGLYQQKLAAPLDDRCDFDSVIPRAGIEESLLQRVRVALE